MTRYLSVDAEIIYDNILKEAILKIQDNQQLTAKEIKRAHCFELTPTTIIATKANATEELKAFAEMALKRQKITVSKSASAHYGGQASCKGGWSEQHVPI
uniref:Uncharacterized protein n=1 Tax=Amphimedon queenslandica TaxID=400682 RepID=A0A1X7THM0_AMPQE